MKVASSPSKRRLRAALYVGGAGLSALTVGWLGQGCTSGPPPAASCTVPADCGANQTCEANRCVPVVAGDGGVDGEMPNTLTRRLALIRGASYFISSTGKISAWGRNEASRLGDGTNTNHPQPVMLGLTGVVQITGGFENGCAIFGTTLRCWGINNLGELGMGISTADPFFPQPIDVFIGSASGKPVRKVVYREHHGCALVDTTVYCWGDNLHGTVGDGSSFNTRPLPVGLNGLPPVKDICTGGQHSCALLESGQAYCWGQPLVNGSTVAELSPHEVTGAANGAAIVCGDKASCLLETTGTVYCWGYKDFIGRATPGDSAMPINVNSLAFITQIDAGEGTVCARQNDGTVWCWGDNSRGQLGTGNTTNAVVPVQISRTEPSVEVATSGSHTCVRTMNDEIFCVGDNTEGQIGDNTTGFDPRLVFTKVNP